jgi:mRNA interferase MazF
MRGELWWADLGDPRGSEPGLRRPVLVVQDDRLMGSRLQTVMVALLTSNLKRAAAHGNVQLSKRRSGLPMESVVLACQVETLDKIFFDGRISRLDEVSMDKVNTALRLNLGLNEGH